MFHHQVVQDIVHQSIATVLESFNKLPACHWVTGKLGAAAWLVIVAAGWILTHPSRGDFFSHRSVRNQCIRAWNLGIQVNFQSIFVTLQDGRFFQKTLLVEALHPPQQRGVGPTCLKFICIYLWGVTFVNSNSPRWKLWILEKRRKRPSRPFQSWNQMTISSSWRPQGANKTSLHTTEEIRWKQGTNSTRTSSC